MLRITCSLFTIAFLANVFNLNAQNTVSGKITTDKNEALAGANVLIINTTLGSASDADGNYSISGLKNGDYTVRVSYFGYKTEERQITVNNQNVSYDFVLSETTIDLNAVVVTGTRSEYMVGSSPVLTQIIGKNQILQKGVIYLPQVLTTTDASFEMVKDNTVKSFRFDALGPQYTLFLIDGERIGGETKGAVDLSRINPVNVERIEIVKGAASTLYGSNAIGGVVNIITKSVSKPVEVHAGIKSNVYTDPAEDKTRADNYYFTSLNLSKGKLSSFSDVKLNRYAPYDLNSGAGVLGILTQEKEVNYSLNQKFSYKASEKLLLTARANYYHLDEDIKLEGYPDKISTDFTYGAKATYFSGPGTKLEFSWHSDKNKIFDVTSDQGLETKTLDYENLLQNARFLGNYTPGESQKLTAGLEYLGEKQSSLQNNIEDKSVNNFIIYLQDDIQLLQNLSLILGARADFHSNFGSNFTPQASTMFSPGNFKFRASYGHGFRAPTVKELYTDHFRIPVFGSPVQFFLEGNPDLKPEKSRYYSFSTQYSTEKIDISVNYSENFIDNLINYDSIANMVMGPQGPTQIDYIYSNVEEARIINLNVMARWQIINSLALSGSYNYTDPRNLTTDNELVNVRNHSARFNLDFKKRLKIYLLTANLNINYFGKKGVTDIYSHQRPQPTVELDDFTLTNFTTTHTFSDKYTFTLGVNNIFGKTDGQSEYFNFASPGRTFVFGVSLNL